jgi:DNA ligase-1
MLAATLDEQHSVQFPVLATPKIDGIRALKIDGALVSRSFKLIPNMLVRKLLEDVIPEGADGEIVCDEGFHETTSVVMSHDRPVGDLVFYWFDWVPDNAALNLPYVERVCLIKEHSHRYACELIIPLIPDIINDQDTLERYESDALLRGYEGVMLRTPYGRYKCGRSTLSEGLLVKLKRFRDSEAVIVGAEELMHNENQPELDNFGMTVRRSTQACLIGGNKLGALIATTDDGIIFKIGTGYTEELRASLWASRHELIGKLVKYKHMDHGKKTAPRSPVFLGIRHIDDG